MIFGHLGVAALVRATQRDPRGTFAFVALCAAAVVPDILDVGYTIAGVCSPFGLYSHTIPALALETAVVGGLALLITGSRGLAMAFAIVVPLHLAADYFTMHKLVMPGGELRGLDFFHAPVIDFIIELPCIVAGWWALRRSGRGPSWAVTRRALAVVVLLQGVFDAYGFVMNRGFKPNACRAEYAKPVSGI